MAKHFEYYHLHRLRFFLLLVTICFQSRFPKKLKRGDSFSFPSRSFDKIDPLGEPPSYPAACKKHLLFLNLGNL